MNLFPRSSFSFLFKLTAFYLAGVFFLLLLTFIHPFPTDVGFVGLTAGALDIGDRPFYVTDISEPSIALSHGDSIKPLPLYPLILKTLHFILLLFGQSSNHLLWNLLAILSCCFCNVVSIRLLYSYALKFYDFRVAKVALILFVLSPYTYFYTISGGITAYMVLGVSILAYSLSSCIESYLSKNQVFPKDSALFVLSSVILSFLRPTGAICVLTASILTLMLLLVYPYVTSKHLGSTHFYPVLIICISLSLILVFQSEKYISINLSTWPQELGSFLGYPRDSLRQAISSYSTKEPFFAGLLFITWKILDLITGFSDIRDSFLAENHSSILPFIFRVASGVLFLAPFNFLAFLSLLLFRRFLVNPCYSIPLISSLVAVSPSLLGVAMSRYWVMFYFPFFPIVALLLVSICSKTSKVPIRIA